MFGVSWGRDPARRFPQAHPASSPHAPHTPATPSYDPPGTQAATPSYAPPGTGAAPLSRATGDRYEIGAEIARGGMGAVHRATDTALGREVAVKVLQDRFAPTSGVARRFADEARITGQLQHPNIPAVHDLGTLPDGRPFLAMKLIKGDTLDELLKARRDPSADRGHFLGVFEKVCEAVAYAHAHGVLHRDLKPQNVMVGAFGEVQVMDWGLAKVLTLSREAQPSDPDATAAGTAIVSERDSDDLLTQAGSVLGTPAYMPPEQAIGAVDQIDRRSDVFGLGGILASILTGKPPFVGPTAESTRQLAAKGKLTDCFERLDGCGAESDLIDLCKRCLAGEPADRPADAKAVASAVASAVAALRAAADERARRAELDRVKAEGDRAAVELQASELRKRRRVWVGLAGTLAAGLLAAGGLAVAADRARRAEAEQRAAAEAKEAEAAAVIDFFERYVLAAPQPEGEVGGQGVAVTVRDAVAAAVPALATGFADRPLVEARLRNTIGNTFLSLGDYPAATAQYEQVVAIRRAALGSDDPDTLAALGNLALGYDGLGRRAEAITLQERTLADLTRAFGPDHKKVLDATVNLCISFDTTRRAEAIEMLERVVAVRTRELGPDHPDTLNAIAGLATRYNNGGRRAEGLSLLERVHATRLRLYGQDHPDTLRSMQGLAYVYTDDGRWADAVRLDEQVLAAYRRTLPPDHPRTLGTLTNLAKHYSNVGRFEDARRVTEESLAGYLRVLGEDHPKTINSRTNLTGNFAFLGQHADVIRVGEPALAVCRRRLPANDPTTVMCLNNLAYSYSAVGRHAEAVAAAAEAAAGGAAAYAPDHPQALLNAWTHVEVLVAAGREAEAVPVIDRCVRLQAGKPGNPGLIPAVMDFRLGHFKAVSDPAGCRATAEMWERLNRTDPASLLAAARYRAAAAGLSADGTADADKAMRWLRAAVAAGLKSGRSLWQNPDFDPLRGRPDFRQLLADLGAAREPAPKPRRGQ